MTARPGALSRKPARPHGSVASRVCRPAGSWLTWLPGLLLLAMAASSHAQDLQGTVGLKTWFTSWTSWGLAQNPYNGQSYQTVSPLNSDTEASFIPQVSLRYGRWLLSTSYMTSTHFTLSSAQPAGPLQSLGENRREVDANVGYFVMPGLAVTAGYKQLDQSIGGGTLTWGGPTLGLAGTVPIGSYGLAAYGSFGFGWLHLTVPPNLTDAAGDSGFNASYLLAELGLAYSFGGRFTVTLGYRSQTVRTDGYQLGAVSLATSNAPNVPYATTELKDITQGLTLGLTASF